MCVCVHVATIDLWAPQGEVPALRAFLPGTFGNPGKTSWRVKIRVWVDVDRANRV